MSASDADFSWELTNKLILTTPTVEEVDAAECSATARFGSADSVISLIPALLDDPARLPDDLPGPRCAVILARKNATTIAEVDAVAQLITKVGFTIRAVVIVDCDNRRWRRWRRFSLAFGVGSDPERPWPTIDVLEEEKRRSAESTRHGHVRR
ncbi:hypothetical protein [Mycolicibacterium sp.]|uniref:hypothetical protein n=1 Tax=Mycolicibacterium sp. TaxID=2320850 RepID=UPI001A1D1B05|nr:hypothetical protein [Mycolicibacterium sp.]MBJ7339114.1 hypothetical protein [Mycolicibacterium sp.]